MQKIETMSLFEYQARIHAYRLKQIDKKHEMHLQAWLNHQVTAKKEKGSKQVPVFEKFKDFFDYEKELREVDGVTSALTEEHKRMARIAKSYNERR